ncbi:MAG: MmgE/PrpD family protein [Pseudomonadota bacterium]
MTVIEEFADWVAGLEAPVAARAAARRCLLDTLGGIIAGGVEAPATLLAGSLPGSGPVRLIPEGMRDARTAALINGAAAHTVEVDDIYSPGLYHPGVCVIPAALAMAEAEGADGATLLDGIIAGYEVSNRIARIVNPAHYEHWHTTATVGHFGAAVATARVAGLSAEQTGRAMAGVASMAAGLRHAFSSDAMTKPMHAGRAAEAGVLSALAARAGVTGVLDMLEGVRGFGISMSDGPDWAEATSTLGTEWTITRMTVKAHACCGHNFSTLDGVRAIMTAHGGLHAEEIATIHARVYRATAEICGNPDPRTKAEAQFSLPYCTAVMAQRGAIVPDDFSEEALANPITRTLASKVSFEIDPAHEAAFPDLRPATTEITTTDGRHFTHTQPTRKGDPDAPLTDAEITDKFHGLAAPVLGADGAEALALAIQSIDKLRDIRDLPLQRPTARAAE